MLPSKILAHLGKVCKYGKVDFYPEELKRPRCGAEKGRARISRHTCKSQLAVYPSIASVTAQGF